MVNTAITHRINMDVFLMDFTRKHTLEDNKVTAGKCGAIEAVVSAMKTHLNNTSVCHYGCWALTNFTINNGKYCYYTQN